MQCITGRDELLYNRKRRDKNQSHDIRQDVKAETLQQKLVKLTTQWYAQVISQPRQIVMW